MRNLTFACAALVLLAAPAGAATVYKWVDDEGQVHYGSQPPPQAQPAEMDLRTIGPAETAAGATGEPPADTPPTPTDAEPAPQQAPDTAEQSAALAREQCDKGRKNLAVLRDGGPSQRYRKPDGSVFRYSGDDYTEELARTERLTQEYCAQAEG